MWTFHEIELSNGGKGYEVRDGDKVIMSNENYYPTAPSEYIAKKLVKLWNLTNGN